jgi:hypothetical protein
MIVSTDPDERFEFYSAVATTVGGSFSVLQWIPSLFHAMAPGAALIWAGHRAEEHQDIKARLEEFFEPISIGDVAGWPVILLQKQALTS